MTLLLNPSLNRLKTVKTVRKSRNSGNNETMTPSRDIRRRRGFPHIGWWS